MAHLFPHLTGKLRKSLFPLITILGCCDVQGVWGHGLLAGFLGGKERVFICGFGFYSFLWMNLLNLQTSMISAPQLCMREVSKAFIVIINSRQIVDPSSYCAEVQICCIFKRPWMYCKGTDAQVSGRLLKSGSLEMKLIQSTGISPSDCSNMQGWCLLLWRTLILLLDSTWFPGESHSDGSKIRSLLSLLALTDSYSFTDLSSA